AQVVAHLSAQCPFDQGLLQGQRCRIDGFGRHWAVAKLFKQFGRDRRQYRRRGLRLARHHHSLSACYALNTKLLTGPRRGIPRYVSSCAIGTNSSRAASSAAASACSAPTRRAGWLEDHAGQAVVAALTAASISADVDSRRSS